MSALKSVPAQEPVAGQEPAPGQEPLTAQEPVAARGRGAADDRGSVTAELAVVLPVVVLVLLLGAATLGACAKQVRLQDAAADAARLVARDEPASRAQSVVASAVGGAAASIEYRGDLVCVEVAAPAGLPLPIPPLTARSCALVGGL